MKKRKTKRERRDRYAELMIPMALALPVVVLHEDYGFGAKKRAPELAEKLLAKVMAIQSGEIEMEKVISEFETLTGMRIE